MCQCANVPMCQLFRMPACPYALVLGLLLIPIGLISCRQSAVEKTGPVRVRTQFTNQPDPDEIGNHIASFEVIPIEYSKEKIIGEVNLLTGIQNRFLIYNSKYKLFNIIDRKGKIIRQVGNFGNGPCEYVQPDQVTLTPEGNFAVSDGLKGVIQEYSPDGNCIREIPLPKTGSCESFAYLDAKTVLLGYYRVQETENGPGYYIRICDRDLQIQDSLIPFYTSWPMGGISPEFTPWEGNMIVTKNGDYRIFQIDAERRIDTLVVMDYGENGYDFSDCDHMSFEDYIRFHGTLVKPLSAGKIYPQHNGYMITTFFKDEQHIAFCTWDQEEVLFRLLKSHEYLGFYKGFPVPRAISLVDGRITGSFEAIDVLDLWEEYPDQKARAAEEPEFRKIMDQLDAEDNPLIVSFTLDINNNRPNVIRDAKK